MSNQNQYVNQAESQTISYIVSAYDRSHLLPICLASLLFQTHTRSQLIVTDNSVDPLTIAGHRRICKEYRAQYINTRSISCYHSAEIGAEVAVGQYLCFPSDDSYFMPTFAELMLKAAYESDSDLVYCEMVHNETPLPHRGTGYRIRGVEPRVGYIDKTGFIVRRSMFGGFPCKPVIPAPSAADGALVELLINNGARHKKIDDVLVVHN